MLKPFSNIIATNAVKETANAAIAAAASGALRVTALGGIFTAMSKVQAIPPAPIDKTKHM